MLTTPNRGGENAEGQRAHKDRGSGWHLSGFRELIEEAGLEVMFDGLVAARIDGDKETILSVVRRPRRLAPPPPEFRVVALVGTYNEEDVIESFLQHNVQNGIEVLLLDNWSTDRTVERASAFLGRGLRGIVRFPEGGPTLTHEWHAMLQRKAELASEIEADWFIHEDPDEIRESPWPGLRLREAFYRAESDGFNAVDHTCIAFQPMNNAYDPAIAIQEQFSYFEFGVRPGHFNQVKAWKRQSQPVELAESGGHNATFPGRRVYPFKFLLRHYQIRSEEHGKRKVFQERIARLSPALRQGGWHAHYYRFSPTETFLRDPSSLRYFQQDTFYTEYVVERLSGLGFSRP